MKFNTFKFSVVFLLFTLMVSCTSTYINYSAPEEVGINPDLSFNRSEKLFNLKISAPVDLIKNTQMIYLVINLPNKPDTLYFKNIDLTNLNLSLNKLDASILWDHFNDSINLTSKIDLIIVINNRPVDFNNEKSNNKYYKKSYLLTDILQYFSNKAEDLSVLTLKSSIDIKSDSLVVFKLDAVRNKEVPNEYIPNSEVFRVEILNRKGGLEWSSSNNSNFLQVIKKVEPLKIGDSHTYSINWYGKTNNNYSLSDGIYSIKMIIPAKPVPYIVFTKFTWKKNNADK